MSLSPPVATSPLPASPVRRSSPAQDDTQLPASDSHPSSHLPDPIRPPPPSNASNRTSFHRSAHPARPASAFVHHTPQLSERESIFALHYIPSQDELSSPAEEGAHALSPSRNSRTVTDMEVAHASLPHLPNNLLNNKRPFGLSQGTESFLPDWISTTQDNNNKNNNNNNNNITSLPGRRVTSEGLQWSKRPPLPISKAGATRNSHPQQAMTRASREDTDKLSLRDEQRLEIPSASLKQALQGQGTQGERSTSRGRSHIEKSIEATLANVEPGKNVRSRKASHVMGIFRENVVAEDDQKPSFRRRESILERERIPEKPKDNTARIASPAAVLPTDDYFTKTATTPLLDDLEPPQSLSLDASPSTNEQDRADSTDTSKCGNSNDVSPLRRPNHDPYYRKHDKINSAKLPQPPIPASLLQEIREYQNVLPGSTQAAGATIASGIVKPADPIDDEDNGDRRPIRPDELQKREDDDEHMYKMVYYPHPGPTAEEIAKFKSPGDESPEIEPLEKSTQPAHDTARELKEFEETIDTTPSEHIDISVHSKHGKSIFHGDYYPKNEESEERATAKHLPSIQGRLPPSALSTSESEPESGDEIPELSHTDDGEITPTATPKEPSHMLDRTKSKQEGPKGAVVLQPYNHQVGGHSQIYALTKRAIMKQLNNRENEFYELIERNHPDILKFLPRYIGVMNVSFSKVPKPTKPASAGANSSTNGDVDHKEMSGDISCSSLDGHAAHSRIVSKSQAEVSEVPQLLLNQNRHIVPLGLFATPERPRNAEPRQHDTVHNSTLTGVDGKLQGLRAEQSADTTSSLLRPPLPEHSPSWGTTTVNGRLQEQVLREVFAPAPIQHRRRHAPSHSTLRRPRHPDSRRRSNLSNALDEQGRPTDNNTKRTDLYPSTVAANEMTDKALSEETRATPDKYSSSASVFEDVSHALGKMRTNIGTAGGQDILLSDQQPRVKRRHSGMSLRRRRTSISGDEQPDLEYFAEDLPGEEEVFAMDNNGSQEQRTVNAPAVAVSGELPTYRSPLSNGGKEFQGSAGPFEIGTNLARIDEPAPERLPLNPKDAKSAMATAPDEKVVYFLLLENLTYGMGRPCVLDLKMGTRQYGIEADKKKMESQRRKCKTTTSQQLGVRVCGMQSFNSKTQTASYEDKYFGRDLKAGKEFRETLIRFLYDGVSMSSVARHIPTILHKISKLENMIRRLPGYRLYASSLLMIYDAEPENSLRAKEEAETSKEEQPKAAGKPRERKNWPPPIELKLVDFANCVAAETGVPATAKCPPQHPDDIDRGYLRGLRTLKMYFQRILRDINHEQIDQRGEGEGMFGGGQEVTHHSTHEEGGDDETDEVSI